MDNNTFIYNVTSDFFFKPTHQCFDWCKEAHFVNASNIEVTGLFLIGLSLMALVSHDFLKEEENYNKYKHKLLSAAKWFLFAYFLYYFLDIRGII